MIRTSETISLLYWHFSSVFSICFSHWVLSSGDKLVDSIVGGGNISWQGSKAQKGLCLGWKTLMVTLKWYLAEGKECIGYEVWSTTRL